MTEAEPIGAADPRLLRAESLVDAASAAGVPVTVLGGAAVAMLCASARAGGQWTRTLGDVDLAAPGKQRKAVETFLLNQGLAPDTPFNQANGYTRLRFFDADESHVDVFLDELRLCHVITWRKDLQPGMRTIPLPHLLLTKLQVVAFEAKDQGDVSALLTDRWEDILEALPAIEQLVRNDWGLWRTSRGDLTILAASADPIVAERAGQLVERWDAFRLTAKARARGVVGDRVKWYEEPEEV
jgi:hypothetical protein